MRDNDTALDAIDQFQRKLARMAGSTEDSFILLYEVAVHFEEEALDAVLGVADALLDRRPDLGDTARVYLRLFLRDALKPSTLQGWGDPAARVANLERFYRRLHLETSLEAQIPPASWAPTAQSLSEKVVQLIEADRKDAEGMLEELTRNAEAAGLQYTLSERLSFIEMAVGQWELGIVSEPCFDRFLRSVAASHWKFPSKQINGLLEEVSHPAAALLRK